MARAGEPTPIAVLARRFGYTCRTTLYRRFRRAFGLSPQEFRQRVRMDAGRE